MKQNLILVCVTAQESSILLVKAGKELADKYGAKLETVSVLPPDKSGDSICIKTIETIHHMTKDYGGEMMMYFNDDPVLAVIAHIGKRKPMIVVTGYPGENSNNFINTIQTLLPNQEIAMVNGDRVYSIIPRPKTSKKD